MLNGKIVWITGASRGIGQGLALTCARAGAQTVLVARAKPHLQQTERLILTENLLPPILMEYDIENTGAVGQAFSEVFKQKKRLDVVINNAGVMNDALLGMITPEQVEQTFSINVFAAIYHMQYAARLMSRVKSGSIINISSYVGRFGSTGQTVYGASKAALIGATYSAAKELAPMNIRVNAISPGFIDTDLIKHLTPDKYRQRLNLVGMKRIGTADEVAGAALFLASDLSQYITGQVLGVDGGTAV